MCISFAAKRYLIYQNKIVLALKKGEKSLIVSYAARAKALWYRCLIVLFTSMAYSTVCARARSFVILILFAWFFHYFSSSFFFLSSAMVSIRVSLSIFDARTHDKNSFEWMILWTIGLGIRWCCVRVSVLVFVCIMRRQYDIIARTRKKRE